MVPAPALPSWPPPTNPMSSANLASGGAPGYSLPTADPGPAVAAEPAGRTPTGGRASGTRPGAPHPPGAGPTPPHPPGAAPAASHRPGVSPTAADKPGTGPAVPDSPGYQEQRAAGTVYGGPEGHVTVSMPTNQVENSGSLTGHILAQGWTDTPAQRTDTGKVVLVLLIGLGILVVIGLLVVLLAGDAFNNLFDGLLTS
ncbi:hypothetical protein ABNF97_26195 [Plantactinospora sp. B6F1]|uniref:hypothetical protein n=1 Tax=Plantactinospora sp. B6F1 TaxID=3158971 RepID=UPI00102B931C